MISLCMCVWFSCVQQAATVEFPANVSEIVSGEILIVKPCTGNKDPKKIFLSGIRGPKEQRYVQHFEFTGTFDSCMY